MGKRSFEAYREAVTPSKRSPKHRYDTALVDQNRHRGTLMTGDAHRREQLSHPHRAALQGDFVTGDDTADDRVFQ